MSCPLFAVTHCNLLFFAMAYNSFGSEESTYTLAKSAPLATSASGRALLPLAPLSPASRANTRDFFTIFILNKLNISSFARHKVWVIARNQAVSATDPRTLTTNSTLSERIDINRSIVRNLTHF